MNAAITNGDLLTVLIVLAIVLALVLIIRR